MAQISGMAVAELEFQHPDYVSKAEKSWKLIASSLQSILGCNVEIRINLAPCTSVKGYAKVKKPSFSFFSCSRRMRLKSHSTSEHGSDQSDCSDFTSEKAMIRDKTIGTCSSDCGSQVSHVCYLRTEAARTLRNREGNVLGIGTITPHRSFQDEIPKGTGFEVGSSKEEQSSCGCQEPENQPNCLFNTFGLHKKLRSSEASQMTCLRYQAQNKLALSVPKNTSFEPYFWANDRYAFSSSSNNFNSCPRDEDGWVVLKLFFSFPMPFFPVICTSVVLIENIFRFPIIFDLDSIPQEKWLLSSRMSKKLSIKRLNLKTSLKLCIKIVLSIKMIPQLTRFDE